MTETLKMATMQNRIGFYLREKGSQSNLRWTLKNPTCAVKATSRLFVLSVAFYLIPPPMVACADSSNTKNFNIPASPLSKGISQFAGQNGINLSFDPALTAGKQTTGLKGEYGVIDGFHELLKDSGLHIVNDAKGGYFLEKIPVKLTPPVSSQNPGHVDVELSKVKIRAKRFKQVGPMPGLELTKEQIAGNIQSVSAKEIKESHSLSLSDLFNSKLQSVNVNDYQGNPFQMDVTYRGFTASPQIGTPQGLSVFFDGVRVNEPFGDVVNWDMIPMNAISGLDVFPGSNPLFGLNTLGGSFVMKTKSGFTDAGISAEILAGSYGRKQLQASGGWNNANKEEGSWDSGDYAAFGAVNLFLEDGWRDNSPSKVNQAYGKLEWQGERTSLSFSALGATNKLVGNGTVPQELYREDPSAVFTSPDETKNRLMQFKIAGAFDVNDNFNITGQLYNRNSKRYSNTGDIIDTETFQPDGTYVHYATRLPGTGGNLHCAYADDDGDGVPNYFKITEANYFLYQQSLGTGTPNNNLLVPETSPGGDIPDDLRATIKQAFSDHVHDFVNDVPVNGVTQFGFLYNPYFNLYPTIPFTENDGTTSYVWSAPPVNLNTCQSLKSWNQGMIPKYPFAVPPATDQNLSRDGAIDGGPGVIEGTPTAIITDTNIQQNTTGAAVQFNWNYDTHKFMVGASVDKSRSSYLGKQRLGIMDNNRNVFNDPSQMGEEYYFADHDATINDFSGTSDTKSLYFSETWMPTQTLNLSVSGRYNETQVKNKLSPTVADRTLTGLRYLNRYAYGIICPGTDLSNCPYSLDKPIDAEAYYALSKSDIFKTLKFYSPPATEKFSFYSFNPALGATWQAKPNLNLYANWNQGTRAPSVIELGCAYDKTLVPWTDEYGNPQTDGNGDVIKIPRSLNDGRGCKLPSALSGDPFLPQVKAQTFEAGARGKFNDFLEWNITGYRTNVRDDIYMTTVQTLNFFQSIGDTRRQGIEFGLAGEYGKSDFRINYSLTEATFQSNFLMTSENNSSRNMDPNSGTTGMIQVKPGNVMPGVPFNNLNFNWGYKFTPEFKVNLSLVAHSRSYLRGNENNAHAPSPGRTVTYENGVHSGTSKTQSNGYSGTAPGYGVLNMNARYDFGKGWAASVLVNNVLDKKYYTAGRLGVNPMAPSIIGAIGPGGFNYNSNEWIPSQFISAGAPRGIWASLSYDFDAARKSAVSGNPLATEPNLADLELTSSTPSAEEVALSQRLDKIKALPVLRDIRAATELAEQEVTTSVENWRKALAENNTEKYLKHYVDNYAPTNDSHTHWAEQQKMQFVTANVQSAEVSDLVVVDQGKRMLAYFNESISREGKQNLARKVLTFEQKQGQWLIVKEHVMPARGLAKLSEQKASLNESTSTSSKNKTKKNDKVSNTKLSTVVAEVK